MMLMELVPTRISEIIHQLLSIPVLLFQILQELNLPMLSHSSSTAVQTLVNVETQYPMSSTTSVEPSISAKEVDTSAHIPMVDTP